MTRREWLGLAGRASAGAWLVGGARVEAAPLLSERRRRDGPTLQSFVDPLPIPPVLIPEADGSPLAIRLRPGVQKVHRDLPPTRIWGYNGIWPGPTIEVRRGRPAAVHWINDLPDRHFLPIDTTIHGAGASVPAVRTVTHVHGARALPEHDGHPEAWSAPDGRTGRWFTAGAFHYPNDQQAATLWYHDHALGITRLNVYAGLAGCWIVRDEEEAALGLPGGPFEIPLVLQDRLFNPDGSLVYPKAVRGTHPVWIQEFFGDAICVNGRAAPYLAVEPRRYRFRLVNASNARFYRLSLSRVDAGASSGSSTGLPMDTPVLTQIGTDGGLLPEPLELRSFVVAPGERVDLVIDFAGHAGARLALLNDAPAPYARGGEVVPRDVMLFTVTKPLSSRDESRVPDRLVPVPALGPAEAVRERFLAITESERPSDGYTIMGLLDRKHWSDPISEEPQAGSTEIWTFANATGDVHPIHVHLTHFQVLNLQRFDVRTYLQTGTIVPASPPLHPEVNERPAWKDTVKVPPGYLTRVIHRFDPPVPAGQPADSPRVFEYVWHCHILEHEDNEMMRPYRVVGPIRGKQRIPVCTGFATR